MKQPWKKREQIGDVTLYLGDCRDVLPALGVIDSVVTDPPYGMAFQSNHRKEKHKQLHNDNNADMLIFACGIPAHHSKYVFCRWDNLTQVPKPKSWVTWVKDNWSMGDLKHEHGRKTEGVLFYRGARHFFPKKRPADVVTASRTGNTFHPTQKPIDLMQEIVSWTHGKVFDPFMGSGSTLVACVKSQRQAVGIETDKKHFNTACERVQSAHQEPALFTNQTAPIGKQEDLKL